MNLTTTYLILFLAMSSAVIPDKSHGDTNSVFTVASNGVYEINWTGTFRSDREFQLTVVDDGKVLYHGPIEGFGGFVVRPLSTWKIIWNISLKLLYASIVASLLFHFAHNLWRSYERSS